MSESILTDRLLSFVNAHGAGFDPEAPPPRIAAQAFVEHAQGVAQRGVQLVQDVKRWHRQRLAKAGR